MHTPRPLVSDSHRLHRALNLIGVAVYLLSASVSSVFVELYMYLNILVTFFTLPLNELSLVGLVFDLVD